MRNGAEQGTARAVFYYHAVQQTAAILTHGLFQSINAKTAHGLVRGPSRYRILGVIDHAAAGRDAGEALDGVRRGIPIFATLAELVAAVGKPDLCVVGIATPGGVLPAEFRAVLREALGAGIGLVSGLHTFLSDDAELADAARRAGVAILDVRQPKARAELHFWSGAIRAVRAPRIAVLGTDCALGKRTTCQFLLAACRAEGMSAEMIYTGQTGWLQGLRWGFILDSTVNDFVSGELENAILACDREANPDLILLEGQSALRNPSGPCGAELIVSGGARGVILQHAPGRRFYEGQETLRNEIAPVEEEICLVTCLGARVLGIALNHEGLGPEQMRTEAERIARETGLPVVNPLREGAGRLVPVVREYLATART